MNNILPIGSVVKVGMDDILYMITSRYPLSKDVNGKVGYYDYTACVYPLGIVHNEEPYFFNHEDILEVLFIGLITPQEEKLREYYLKNIKSSSYPKFSIN